MNNLGLKNVEIISKYVEIISSPLVDLRYFDII